MTSEFYEAVDHVRLKDALRRANVRAETIDQILKEEETEFINIFGYVNEVQRLPSSDNGLFAFGDHHRPARQAIERCIFAIVTSIPMMNGN